MRRFLLLAVCCCAAACNEKGGAPSAPAHAEGTLINGAGSTFFYPLASKLFSDYTKVDSTVRFNYQSIGSGAGIRQITDHTVDFGASDAPLTDEQLAKAPGLLHLPATMGAVAVAYNLPGKPALRLTPDVLARIYLGEIKTWNDPALAAANPGAKLPATPIAVVHRSDGSGTTAIFTDYLAKVSPTWAAKVRHGTSVAWPTGIGGKGNEGVSGQLTQLPGAIGYVELAYAMQNHLPVAQLQNAAGAFVGPSIDSVTAAAASATLPEDLRVSITNSPGKAAYPIAGFTWLLVYKDQTDATKGPALARFLAWEIHQGQADAPPLLYAPLPPEVVKRDEAKIASMTLNGKPMPHG